MSRIKNVKYRSLNIVHCTVHGTVLYIKFGSPVLGQNYTVVWNLIWLTFDTFGKKRNFNMPLKVIFKYYIKYSIFPQQELQEKRVFSMLSLYASRESNEILRGCPFPQFARITKFSEAVSLFKSWESREFRSFSEGKPYFSGPCMYST